MSGFTAAGKETEDGPAPPAAGKTLGRITRGFAGRIGKRLLVNYKWNAGHSAFAGHDVEIDSEPAPNDGIVSPGPVGESYTGRKVVLVGPDERIARKTQAACLDNIHISFGEQRAHLAERAVLHHNAAAYYVEHRQVAVLLSPSGVILIAQSQIHREIRAHVEIIREEEIVLMAQAVLPERRERPRGGRWHAQQKVRIRMSGEAVREAQIAEQIGVCRIVFKDDVGVAHTGAHSVPAARDADVILNGLQIIGRTRTPEIALADVCQRKSRESDVQDTGYIRQIGSQSNEPQCGDELRPINRWEDRQIVGRGPPTKFVDDGG